MNIYIVVEVGWDHHVNIGVFDNYNKAVKRATELENEKIGYSYEVETFKLDNVITV